ncbi:glycosyltransferase family 4 protein [Gloeothece verrucosa]|uniref:Glycosyl transferase group 1 n=1 Tax=Gloeothece verrucosa (strain PCC 7822) TaxID=497965 RepID=E0U5S3_GLOV7|nr:glycosyltransferase family 4 protein [Gloeothece verrucosa]ADN15914.1 glycosyl transferase group 1 [Gloeothece verrucosa PCC 7822]
MNIAYIVNQYPTVSHSFIRREILALEELNLSITRFSHRDCSDKIVDELDLCELKKTNVILKSGAVGLLSALLRVALTRPKRWFEALLLALKLGWLAAGWLSGNGIVRHIIYLAEACVLLEWFSRLDISHVHSHFGTQPTTVVLLCNTLGGPPYSFTVHGPEEFDNVRGMGLPEKIQQASFVIAVSLFGRSQLYRWCEYSQWSKIHVIRCGLDKTFLSQPWQPIPDEPRFVCVGRLSEQKGQLLLVEAVSQLVAEGFTLKLVLVGDGAMREEIETLITNRGLQDTIEITGWATQAQVQQQILAARAMVLPSFAEGLPVVIMESLALGRPVISTYIAGIPELIEPGQSGWLVPAGSVEALAASMRTVLQCPVSELEQMGKRGAERVALQHNILLEAEKLAQLFASQKE